MHFITFERDKSNFFLIFHNKLNFNLGNYYYYSKIDYFNKIKIRNEELY